MYPSVTEFIELYKDKIKHLLGYKRLMSDIAKSRTLVDYSSIASRLLSNYYGSACDDSLCLAFRRFTMVRYAKEMEGSCA